MLHKYDCIASLMDAGISHADAVQLRRISMTLHRWHELECGDSNDYASFCLVRGRKVRVTRPAASTPYTEFVYDDEGTPFLEVHSHKDTKAKYEPVPDRERGALKRLAAIMARYPHLASYIQGDCRGASLYILDKRTTPQPYDSFYSRGIAVYK